MCSSPVLFRLLLIFTLLLAQLGGLTHGVAHAMADQTQDQSLPHDKHCDLCAAYAQVGGALGSGELRFDPVAPLGETFTPKAVSFRSPTFAVFAARAPPRSA